MKLKTFALASVTLATSSLMTNAMAEDQWVEVYGKIMLTLDKVDEDNGDDQWEVNSNASRFGVKGKGAAGSLEAFYQMEWEIDLADSSKSSADHIKARNQVVGLRGGFGEVFMGRHDTPTKAVQKKIDIFGDLTGDIKHAFNGEVRADNIVQYGTPKLGGFQAKLAFVPGEETAVNDGLADGTSLSMEYSTGGLTLGLGLDSDVEKVGADTTRLMAQYKLDAWQFGLMYQDTEYLNADGNGMMASVKYTAGAHSFKLQLIDSDVYESGISDKVKYSEQTSLGWDYKLGKKTTFFTYLTMSEEGVSGDEDSIFGLGLVQKF